ncbi:hypothetical protein IAD21_02047 [Abditibacteriota bacterium]|nr:hypothetical protein IAD21_02047 [Abditibacteriota bacterium]
MFFPFKSSERDPVWKREVRERWRRPWTFLLLGVYAAFLAILARVFYGTLVPQGEIAFSRQGLGLGAPLFWKFVLWQIAGWFPLGLLLGAPSLALERERQSLTEYALAGLDSRQIVRAKWWSLASFALILVVAPLPVAALCFPLGGVSLLDFWSANIFCVGVALASCAIGLSISATHRTVSAAFVDTLKAILSIGIPLGPPLLFFSFSPPPELLIIMGVAFAVLPLHFIPKAEQEIFFVMQHLEIDAPQTPDYTPSEDKVPLRLEPALVKFAEGAAKAHEPMSAQELARYMNAAEVERGRFDPPSSHLDKALENFVARNPVAWRDVHTQLRSWRRQFLLGEPPPIFSLRASFLVGGVMGLMGWASSQFGLATLLYVLWHLSFIPIFLQIILLSASGLTRERAGNMMVQLKLSALSSSEILSAKIVAPFVLGARFWGFPLLMLTLAALGYDASRVGLEAILFALLGLLASQLGTLCSLLFRAISLSTSAALFVLVVLFLVLPSVFSSMLFVAPTPLQTWWLGPVRALIWGTGEMAIMGHLLLSFSVLIIFLWWVCLRKWEKSVA